MKSIRPNEKDFIKLLEQRATENQDNKPFQSSYLHHMLLQHLAWYPWKVFLPLALIISFGLVIVFQSWAVKGVSWLQWGF